MILAVKRANIELVPTANRPIPDWRPSSARSRYIRRLYRTGVRLAAVHLGGERDKVSVAAYSVWIGLRAVSGKRRAGLKRPEHRAERENHRRQFLFHRVVPFFFAALLFAIALRASSAASRPAAK